VLGGLAYLAAGVAAWWHVWTAGAGHAITSQGYGDPAQQVWYLGWVPHALGAGIDPLVSHAMFAPAGINLMANTSILFPALAASPVTVLFGPLVAFNVMVVLAPALSAFAAWRVFCRYTSFEGGAWLAGLFFGYSPFVVHDLTYGHLHITLLAFVPLVFALLDDIAVTGRGSARARGALLGLAVAAQALTSLEVLAMLGLVSVLGLAALAVRYPSQVRPRLPRALTGLGVAAAVAAALLAWPAWVLFAGPRRYRGTVFSSPESYVVWLKALVWPKGGNGLFPQMWGAYVGIPLLVVVLGVALAWGRLRPRNGVLRCSVVLGAIALVFAMGRTAHLTPHLSTHVPLPDRVVTRVPFLSDLLPVRFAIVIDFALSLGLAAALGEVRDRLAERRRRSGAHHRRASGEPGLLPTTGAAALGVLALVSPALGVQWPYPVRQVVVPAVYRSALVTHLEPGSILLGYPVMNGFRSDPLIWQAESGYRYDMVAGYGFIPGPGPHPLGSLPPSPVTNLFGDAQVGDLAPAIPASEERAVLVELERWHVDAIVVLPSGTSYRRLAAILARMLSTRPHHLDGAYVVTGVRRLTARALANLSPAPG
jgi:hypothetical protein